MQRKLWFRGILLGLLATLSVSIFYYRGVRAGTPSSGTIDTPSDNNLGVKQTISYTGGPLAGSTGFSNYSLPVCLQAVTPPGVCDVFNLSVNLPATYWTNHSGNLNIALTWTGAAGLDASLNDLDLFLVDAQGKEE